MPIKNYLIFASILYSTTNAAMDLKSLDAKIFKGDKKKKACQLIVPEKNFSYSNTDSALDTTIANIKELINTQQAKSLQKKFHPRLRIKVVEIKKIFSSFIATYGKNPTISVYKLFALKNQENNPEKIDCRKDEIELRAQYGYPLQFTGIFQINGPKEVGRLIITLVPHQGEWKIGAFHSWQWTYMQKDHQKWMELALENHKNKKAGLAILQLDIAQKLLNGEPYFNSDYMYAYNTVLKETLKQEDFHNELKTILAPRNIAHIGSSFMTDGIALVIRQRIQKEISANALRDECNLIYTTLKSKYSWIAETAGVYCGFLMPNETDPTQDGHLGGMLSTIQKS